MRKGRDPTWNVRSRVAQLAVPGRIEPVADGQATGSNAMYNGHRSAA